MRAPIDGVTITETTANDSSSTGINLNAGAHLSNSHVTDSRASSNLTHGISLSASADLTYTEATGNTASGNSSDGVHLNAGDRHTRKRRSADNTASGNSRGIYLNAGDFLIDATLTNNTATGNSGDGLHLNAGDDNTGATITNNTVVGSGDEGIYANAGDNLQDIEVRGNLVTGSVEFGVFLIDWTGTATSRHVNGNIICSNSGGGLDLANNLTEDAEGNWWGDWSGPTHPNNPGGSGDLVEDGANGGSGTIDYDPWIDTIVISGGPATEGVPSDLTFQFSGGSGTVFLGQGPGDLNGAGRLHLAPRTTACSTSSQGTGATVHEFINQPNGTLKVTLTPDDESDATVTITGPCWLEESVIVAVAGTAPTEPSHRRTDVDADCDGHSNAGAAHRGPSPATVPPPTATPSGGAGAGRGAAGDRQRPFRRCPSLGRDGTAPRGLGGSRSRPAEAEKERAPLRTG